MHFRPRFRCICTDLFLLIRAWVLVCWSSIVIGFQPYVFENFPYTLILCQGPDPPFLFENKSYFSFRILPFLEHSNTWTNMSGPFEAKVKLITEFQIHWKNIIIPFSFLGDYIAARSRTMSTTMIAFKHYIILSIDRKQGYLEDVGHKAEIVIQLWSFSSIEGKF